MSDDEYEEQYGAERWRNRNRGNWLDGDSHPWPWVEAAREEERARGHVATYKGSEVLPGLGAMPPPQRFDEKEFERRVAAEVARLLPAAVDAEIARREAAAAADARRRQEADALSLLPRDPIAAARAMAAIGWDRARAYREMRRAEQTSQWPQVWEAWHCFTDWYDFAEQRALCPRIADQTRDEATMRRKYRRLYPEDA
jgi:hypothetical protein